MKKIIVLLIALIITAPVCFANGAVETVIDKSVEWGTNLVDEKEKFELSWDKDTLHLSAVTAEMEVIFTNRSDILVKVESDKREETHSLNKGDKLEIEFDKKEKDREVEITLPLSILNNLHITSVVGDVDVIGLNAANLTIESVSGDIDVRQTKVDNLYLYMTSGEILTEDVEVANKMIAETTTGEVNIRDTKADSLKLGYTTNTATIVDSGFNIVNIDGVTGRFRGDFTFTTLSIDITTGNIELDVDNVNNYDYQISSFSEIKVGDETSKGTFMKSNNTGKTVNISSTSSKIKIY